MTRASIRIISTRGSSLACALAVVVFLSLAANIAYAVPAFARQTNLKCAACHVAFPELTSFGRQFKLTGYTLGERQTAPLALMGLISRTTIANNTQSDGAPFARNGDVVLEGGSLFAAGKVSDHLGGFIQWSYDNLHAKDAGGFGGHALIDNIDIRYANRFSKQEIDLIYGLTVHNAPTVQDVWNTIPAWNFPYQSPKVASNGNGPGQTFLESQARVAGLGAYAFLNATWYGELSAYRTADHVFSPLRAGATPNPGDAVALHGYNPYWRFAWNKNRGPHSAMIGYYGIVAKQFPDSTQTGGPSDRFFDQGIDAQYQYVSEPNLLTAQLNVIREKTDWHAGFGNGSVDRPSSMLRSFKTKVSYYYQRKYGASIGYFSTSGDADCNRFCLKDAAGAPIVGSQGQNFGARPDTNGFITELSYTPLQNLRLSAQYTYFKKFNGNKINYDGAGRNASDNNTLYLYGWFAF